ncbi:hypothetical protein M5689_013854 [Euphorbia peplus]|nr:hypothetical protein M5689_013854 [Euphorbia peplus]
MEKQSKQGMKGSERWSSMDNKAQKPLFRAAIDDSKPSLQDPILRSDPMVTEEAVLRLPPFPLIKFNHHSQRRRNNKRSINIR